MAARWLILVTFVACALVSIAGQRVADRLATLAADRLTLLARVLAPEPRPQAAEVAEVAPLERPPAIFAATPTTAGKKRPRTKPPRAPQSVFVSAERVLALAESGARPRGQPVPATSQRPAGLRLSGVSALGLGVRDGDVLTEVAGVPATDSGAVIEAVLRARARRVKTISGVCYRGDERYSLVVEQPYLPARAQITSRP